MATTLDSAGVDPVFAEIAKALYGPDVDVREVWDIAKMGDASEVHVNSASPKVSIAYQKHSQAHRVERVPGCPYCKVSVKKSGASSDDNNKGKKALVGGLLFGSAAEGMAVHRSLGNLSKPAEAVKTAAHAAPTKLAPVKAVLGAAAHSKTGRAAEVGLQAVNFGVGLTAARELTKKPKKVTPVAKKGVRKATPNMKATGFLDVARQPRHAYKIGRITRVAGAVNDLAVTHAKKIHAVSEAVGDLMKARGAQHIQPAVLRVANGRARRNGLRLAGATAFTAGAGAGYTAGRKRMASVTVAKADRRDKVHYAGAGAGAVAGGTGSLFGAAKIRDAVKEEHPAKLESAVKRSSKLASQAGVSPARVERIATAVRAGKPGLKPLLITSVAGGASAGLHRYGQHLDRKARVRKSASLEWHGVISKVNEEKRQVFGWASLSVIDGKPVIDLQGDYVDIEEIEKSAYTYVLESRKGGDMHERVSKFATAPKHTADMIESMVITPEKLDAWGLEPDAMPLGWWVGYHVNDDQQWADVLAGKRLGFSIHGSGVRRELVAA